MTTQTVDELLRENEELRRRLEEAEDALRALRFGEADAVLVENGREQVFTLESAERPYQLLVAQVPHPAASLTAEGVIIACNTRFADLLGRPLGSLQGQSVRELAAPDSHSFLQELLRAGQAGEVQGEITLLRGDGTPVPAHLGIGALREGALGSCLMLTDLTERRHYEELQRTQNALRESERRFREMIDALPVAIYTTDARGRLTYFNPAAVEFSGRVPELGTDQWCVTWKLYHADGSPMAHDECPMAIALKEGRIVRGAEAIAERPDGKRIWFTPYPTPFFNAEGRIVGGINMLLDITERKQAEMAIGRLAAIVNSSDLAIVSKDLNGTITSWNESAERLFGYTADEAIGRSILMLIPPDRLNEETTILSRIRRGERVDHYETIRLRKGGKPFNISLTISPVKDASGRIIGASKIARDITERLATQEALKRSERELTDFFENAVLGLHWVGPDGTILRANQAELDLLGYTRDEYVGRNIAEFHADAEVIADILGKLQAGKPVHSYEARLRCKDGSIRHVLINSSVLWEDGRFIHTRCFTGDITDRKRMEETLRAADQRKDEFLATLAHELRGPLAPIRNAIQILKARGPADSDLDSVRGVIDRQLQVMTRLLEDLLDVSRISRNKLELRRERIELAAVIQTALETSQPVIEAAGHSLTVDLPPEPVHLDADPVRLAQVFANLLTNAAKYTENGGQIALTAQQRGSELVVSVKDNGIGILPEMLPKLFAIFAQSPRSLDRAQGGLGIGLSLVKGLVELHGGSITAHSEGPGRGSEFIVRLPLSETPGARMERPSTPTGTVPPATLAKRRILVVDDNEDSADTLTQLLEIMGHEVKTGYDGEQAVALAESMRPDLVLLDIGMPKLNGYDACRCIRKQPWGREMVLVALTGWGQEQDRRRTEEAGFHHHIVKPVDPAMLTKLLASLSARPVAGA